MYFQNRGQICGANEVAPGCGTKMADQSDEPNGAAVVASYVASLSTDLAAMARRSGLDTLGYLLEMVRLEAESVTRHDGSNGRRN